MMKKIVKRMFLAAFAVMLMCMPAVTANATQADTETEAENENLSPLAFEIANFTYESKRKTIDILIQYLDKLRLIFL